MTNSKIENIINKILENCNFSKTSAIAIANFIFNNDIIVLDNFFKRTYDENSKRLIIDLDFDFIKRSFKEFNTIDFISFIKDDNNRFDKNKIIYNDDNCILYNI